MAHAKPQCEETETQRMDTLPVVPVNRVKFLRSNPSVTEAPTVPETL